MSAADYERKKIAEKGRKGNQKWGRRDRGGPAPCIRRRSTVRDQPPR